MTMEGHWSAPGLEQVAEIASGILPREVTSLDQIKSPAAKAMWPTPCARDYFPPHKPEYIAAKKAQGHGMSNLNDAAALRIDWPTPRVNDAEKRGTLTPNPRNGLAGEVQTWATPTTRDHKSGKASQETHDRNSRPLSEQVGDLLNPTWVEWLMGWPIDWTDPDGGPSSEGFREWLESNRTALTAYVGAATVRWHCVRPSPGSCSVAHD